MITISRKDHLLGAFPERGYFVVNDPIKLFASHGIPIGEMECQEIEIEWENAAGTVTRKTYVIDTVVLCDGHHDFPESAVLWMRM